MAAAQVMEGLKAAVETNRGQIVSAEARVAEARAKLGAIEVGCSFTCTPTLSFHSLNSPHLHLTGPPFRILHGEGVFLSWNRMRGRVERPPIPTTKRTSGCMRIRSSGWRRAADYYFTYFPVDTTPHRPRRPSQTALE